MNLLFLRQRLQSNDLLFLRIDRSLKRKIDIIHHFLCDDIFNILIFGHSDGRRIIKCKTTKVNLPILFHCCYDGWLLINTI